MSLDPTKDGVHLAPLSVSSGVIASYMRATKGCCKINVCSMLFRVDNMGVRTSKLQGVGLDELEGL